MVYRIPAFRGIDQSVEEGLLEPCDSPDAQNMDTEDGCLAVARGIRRLTAGAVPGAVRTLFVGYRRGGASELFAATDDEVYRREGEGWVQVLTGTGGGAFSYLNYQQGDEDVLLCANGVHAYRWDGTAFARWEGCPQAFSLLALHVERVWGAGIAAEPDAVYWSRSFDAQDWAPSPEMPEAGGGFVHLPTWNGGRVIGLQTIFNDVVVFKDDDLFRIYGTYPGDYEVSRVHGVVGPIAPRTIVCGGTMCYFLGKQGLCAYDGVAAQPLADQRAKRFLRNLDAAYVARACAAVHDDVLYLAVPEKGYGYNNAVLEVDLKQGRYMIRRGFRVDCFLVWDDRLLFADDEGRVYVYGEGDDYDGRPIEAYWRTPATYGGSLDGMKHALVFLTAGEGGWLSVEHRTERMSKSKSALLTQGRRVRLRLLNKGRRIGLVLRNVAGSRFAIRAGIEWYLENEED